MRLRVWKLGGEMVPSADWFIYAFVRNEAVISSQIEGTQATLIDLFEYEAEQASRVAGDDVYEVCNYLDAIKYARANKERSRAAHLHAFAERGAPPSNARSSWCEQAARQNSP